MKESTRKKLALRRKQQFAVPGTKEVQMDLLVEVEASTQVPGHPPINEEIRGPDSED